MLSTLICDWHFEVLIIEISDESVLWILFNAIYEVMLIIQFIDNFFCRFIKFRALLYAI